LVEKRHLLSHPSRLLGVRVKREQVYQDADRSIHLEQLAADRAVGEIG